MRMNEKITGNMKAILHELSTGYQFPVMFSSNNVIANPNIKPKLTFAYIIEPVFPERLSGDISLI